MCVFRWWWATLHLVSSASGIRPLLSIADRRALGAAVSLVAIAIRNVQLLTQTRESSVRDQLTGCFNRAYAIESLGSELQRSRRSGRPLSVMMFDVDKLNASTTRTVISLGTRCWQPSPVR